MATAFKRRQWRWLCSSVCVIVVYFAAFRNVWSVTRTQAAAFKSPVSLSDVSHRTTISLPSSPTRRALFWYSAFFSNTGFGAESRELLTALGRCGLMPESSLYVTQHGELAVSNWTTFMDAHDAEQLRTFQQLSRGHTLGSVLGTVASSVAVCHSVALCWTRADGHAKWGCPGFPCPRRGVPPAYRIGRAMSEADSIPQDFVVACNGMDEVWVPSPFHKAVFLRSGVQADKLFVVPESVNSTLLNPANYTAMKLPQGSLIFGHPRRSSETTRPTVFLAVFKWELRKGWDILLETYLQEFKAAELVELYILTHPFGKDANITQDLQEFFDGRLRTQMGSQWRPNRAEYPPVYLYTSVLHTSDIARFYKAASAVVLPTRGEGWGRPQTEAMSMGRPLISTNWSSIPSYLDATVGYPLAISGLEPAGDKNGAQFIGANWAIPNVKHLAALMREVMQEPEAAEAKGLLARQRMVEQYSPSKVGQVIVAQMDRIDAKLGPVRKVWMACKKMNKARKCSLRVQNAAGSNTTTNYMFVIYSAQFDLKQPVPETLLGDILQSMYAVPKVDFDLEKAEKLVYP